MEHLKLSYISSCELSMKSKICTSTTYTRRVNYKVKGFIILKNINEKVTIVNYAIKEHNGVLWNNEGIMEHYYYTHSSH